eukprot:m.902192 g.902192  ORF g.902192 m.902192 type:complete len:965 (+) comp60061_c0_seq29:224-3118(+)
MASCWWCQQEFDHLRDASTAQTTAQRHWWPRSPWSRTSNAFRACWRTQTESNPGYQIRSATSSADPRQYAPPARPAASAPKSEPAASKASKRVYPPFLENPQMAKLLWNPALGGAVVTDTERLVDLQVTTLQMLLLLAFNDGNKTKSFSELVQTTGMDERDARTSLDSLCHSTHPVLLRTHTASSHSPVFSVNQRLSPTSALLPIASTVAEGTQAFVQKLAHVASDNTRIDTQIVAVLKSKYHHDNVTFKCVDCKQTKSGSLFLFEGQNLPTVCWPCTSAKTKSKEVRQIGVGLSVRDVQQAVRDRLASRMSVSDNAVEVRIRRLLDEEVIALVDKMRIAFSPWAPVGSREEVKAPRALVRKISRQQSVAPLMLGDDLLAPIDPTGEGLIRLIAHLEARPPQSSSFEELSYQFVSRQVLLRDLNLVVREISETLGVSHAVALNLFSHPAVKWNHRLAYDAFYALDVDRSQLPLATQLSQDEHPCAFRDYVCVVDDSEQAQPLYTLPCGHVFHQACLREILGTKCLGLTAAGAKSDQKGTIEVVGAKCPALNQEGQECCQEPIPWAKLLDSDIFSDVEDRAMDIIQNELLNKRIQESAFLHSCPGRCNRVVLVSQPLSNRTNAIYCDECKISFCFKCRGRWYEDHRPATCQHMLLWGASVFGTDQSDHASVDDKEILSRMRIFRTTVCCPGCGNRVEKSSGCSHLTCGASSYRGADWRGRGCGLDFCELCELPLKETNCGVNQCNKPTAAAALKKRREALSETYKTFQEYYMTHRDYCHLLDNLANVWPAYGDRGQLLLNACAVFVRARLMYAHSIIFMKVESFGSEDLRASSTLKAWQSCLKTSIGNLKTKLLKFMKSGVFGLPESGWVTCHSSELSWKPKRSRCAICSDGLCTNTYQSVSYELCSKCYFANVLLPETLDIDQEVASLNQVMDSFLRAFESRITDETKLLVIPTPIGQSATASA